jgi:tetratricopeptide (TPR) repeat protein
LKKSAAERIFQNGAIGNNTMNAERLAHLQKFLKENPDDAFLHYAIALEYRATEPDKAERLLDAACDRFPDYLPAFQTAAFWKAEAGSTEQALALIQRALELARLQGNRAAEAELNGLRQAIAETGN